MTLVPVFPWLRACIDVHVVPDALSQPFIDRREAGAVLAQQLRHYANQSDVIVLALPRGGVPVGYEVATVLGVRLDVFPVRKLGVPGQPELAMGAIAPGGVRVLNKDVIDWFGIPQRTIEVVAQAEQQELERRERQYRQEQHPLDLRGQTVILVDDGLATGSTMHAAIEAARRLAAARVIVAAPVGNPDVCRAVAEIADEVICARQPSRFHAVGTWYHNFSATSDGEVEELLNRARQALAAMQP
jgi:predicted phosphoribosyltransferase